MTRGSDPLRALEDAALASAERGHEESAVELAAELLRRDPGNEAARRILDRTEVDAPGELRRLTVLFCDLVGSTSMSARHHPDVYHRVLQRYHRMCDAVIAAHGGTVNRRAGDGILAVFGHPRSHEDDTRRAVRAGLALLERVAQARPEIEREVGESIHVRIAIHLGPVHLDLLELEIYGLAPNIAARLQDLAAPGTLVVSDEVFRLVEGLFEAREHEPQLVKGFDEPVAYHTIERELPQTPGRGRAWRTPFVGRTEARRRLRDAIEQGSPAIVRGEPGIGKSRLVAEVLRDRAAGSPRVVTVVCSEYEQTADFGAAAGLLRLDPALSSAQRSRERLRQLIDDLGTLGLDPDEHTGLLAPLLGIEPSMGYDRPAADPTRVHDLVLASLRAWLTAMGSHEPTVVWVEDLHWADSSTFELLQDLVRDPVEGIHLVMSERPGGDRLDWSGLVDIDLGPLSAQESIELARAIDVAIDGERLDATLHRGQGNPLFIEELARHPGVGEPLDPELLTRLSDSAVPGALYEPLLTRLYTSGTDVGLAQAAATIGRGFSRAVLAAVLPRPPEVLERGLGSLLDAGLLDVDDDGIFWFRHALIRDVAYDLQPRDQRVRMHRRVAEALRAQREDGIDVPWSVIATHYHAAGRVDDAVESYAAAADDSRQRGSMAVGVRHLDAAIDLIVEHGSGDHATRLREVDLRLKRGFLCVSTGGNADPRAVADYERCLELIREEGHGPELVGTLVALWGYHTARGDLARADELLDDIRATGITDDPVMLAENCTARGMVRFFQGDFVASGELLRLALEGAPDRSRDPSSVSPWQFPNDPVTFLFVQYGLARWQRGDLAGFRELIRRAHQRAGGLPRPHGPFNRAYTLTYESWVLTEIGDHDGSAARVESLLEVSDRYGFDFWTLAGTTADAVNRGRASLATGRIDTSLLLEQAERLGGTALMTQMIDSKLLLPYGLTLQGELRTAAADHRGARTVLDQALAVAEETGSRFYRAETLRHRARVRRALGEPGAEEDLQAAVEMASRQGSIPFELRARLDLAELGHRSRRLEELLADPRAVEASGHGHRDLQSLSR